MKILLFWALIITGCESKKSTFPKKIEEKSTTLGKISKSWSEGEDLEKSGAENIAEGKTEVNQGEKLLEQGQQKIEKGNSQINEGHRKKINSENSYIRITKEPFPIEEHEMGVSS